MQRSDFQDRNIQYFTPEEIEATGAKLEDVQPRTIEGLDYIRKELGRSIRLIKNGLTTGRHSSREHPEGKAVDFYISEDQGPITQSQLYLLVQSAIDIGFRGIGFYYNGKTWSFHLDLRKNLALWTGRKNSPGRGSWVYKRMSIGFPAR